jgi:hypothetical protein
MILWVRSEQLIVMLPAFYTSGIERGFLKTDVLINDLNEQYFHDTSPMGRDENVRFRCYRPDVPTGHRKRHAFRNIMYPPMSRRDIWSVARSHRDRARVP